MYTGANFRSGPDYPTQSNFTPKWGTNTPVLLYPYSPNTTPTPPSQPSSLHRGGVSRNKRNQGIDCKGGIDNIIVEGNFLEGFGGIPAGNADWSLFSELVLRVVGLPG